MEQEFKILDVQFEKEILTALTLEYNGEEIAFVRKKEIKEALKKGLNCNFTSGG